MKDLRKLISMLNNNNSNEEISNNRLLGNENQNQLSDSNINKLNNNYFINDITNNDICEDLDNTDTANIIECFDGDFYDNNYASFSLFHINRDLIKIPSKIHRTLRKYTPKHLLRDIHKDLDIAIEMCLILTTQLTSTYFGIKDGTNPQGWKSLHATYLKELLSLHSQTYKKVITALSYPLANGQIIECDGQYIIGEKNLFYRLGESYLGKGIQSYEVTTKQAKNVLNKYYFRTLATSIENPICQNLINTYANVALPTEKQILQEAKRLIDLGYTKKGKKLCFLNKHTRTYFKDADKRIFVEDAIEVFKYLTDNGLMIPIAGGESSGGRVVDSFSLMPSWIRKMVKINKQIGVECDFTCLHPNQVMKIYHGKSEFITHGKLDLVLGLEDGQAKLEHLSFFNKKVWQMKQSSLYNYYEEHEPQLLQSIIQEKYTSQYGHKITSRKLFKMEVEIMTDIIEQLNNEGIYVLYVYDALLCEPKYAEIVTEKMNETILKHDVKTQVKATYL